MNKEEMIRRLKKVKLRHKFLRKIGICPYIDVYNMRIIRDFLFDNIKNYMQGQTEFNDDVSEFISKFGNESGNIERGMVQ